MTEQPPEPFAWRFCPICGKALAHDHDGQSAQPHCASCRRFYYLNPVPATCCFVARSDGALLFARRAVAPCKGRWCLPGGYLELGETAEEGALRELREETNLRASRVRLLGVSTHPSPVSGAVMVLGYVVEDWTGLGGMRPDTDASELRFFRLEERPALPFAVHRDLLALYDRENRGRG